MTPIKILFLAANPADTQRLQLDEEVRAINYALLQSTYRDHFVLIQEWAVRHGDLQGILLRHQPTIVHFGGHGSEAGEIVLLNENGESHPVSAQALRDLFAVLSDNIRCAVLNACFSEQQATAILQHLGVVIGMPSELEDKAATNFAAGFYQALGYGRSIQAAFELGCAQIDLANLHQVAMPQLHYREGCNPAQIRFVPSASSPSNPPPLLTEDPPPLSSQPETWRYHAVDGVASIAMSADGRQVIAGTLGKKVLALDRNGQLQWQQEVGNQAWRAEISHNGRIAVIGTGSTRPWDQKGRGLYAFAADGRQLWSHDLKASVWGLALSADGTTAAAGTSAKQLRVYDQQGHQLWQQDIPGFGWYAWVWAAALSADGKVVAAGAADRRVRIFDRGGNLLTEHRTRADVFAVTVSASGTDIVAGDKAGYIYWFDGAGQLRWELPLHDQLWAVKLSERGEHLLVGADEKLGHLLLYRRDGQRVWRRSVGGSVSRVALSVDAQRVVAATRAGGIHILDAEGNILQQAQAGKIVRDVAISVDGSHVVACSEDGWIYGFHLPQITHKEPRSLQGESMMTMPVRAENQALPKIEKPRNIRLSSDEEKLLALSFVDAVRVNVVREFSDGRTATRVFLVRPTGEGEVVELPVVIKMGAVALVEEEWQAGQRHLLRRLPGLAPIQGKPVAISSTQGHSLAALRYQLVGEGIFVSENLRDYSRNATLSDLWHVLENRLFKQLRHLWDSTIALQTVNLGHCFDPILPVNLVLALQSAQPGASSSKMPLLQATALATLTHQPPTLNLNDLVQLAGFVVSEVNLATNEVTLDLPPVPADNLRPAYRIRLKTVAEIERYAMGQVLPMLVGKVLARRIDLLHGFAQTQLARQVDLTTERLPLTGNPSVNLPNPLRALPQLLGQHLEVNTTIIHGDLNLRNILVDPEARSTQMIDCAAARHDYVLHDLWRMERDVLTDLLPGILFQAGLPAETIYTLYRAVNCAAQPQPVAPGQFAIPGDLPAALQSVYLFLLTLRQVARHYLAKKNQWQEYYAGLVVHLLGALKFKDLDEAPAGYSPKAIAFWGAATALQWVNEPVDCRSIAWQPFDLTAKGREAQGSGETTQRVPREQGGVVNQTNFLGAVTGPIHTGSGNIYLTQGKSTSGGEVRIARLVSDLRRAVETNAPSSLQAIARQQVDLLLQAVSEADVDRMEAVLQWFRSQMPEQDDRIVAILLHPTVLQIFGGDYVNVAAFRQRLGL